MTSLNLKIKFSCARVRIGKLFLLRTNKADGTIRQPIGSPRNISTTVIFLLFPINYHLVHLPCHLNISSFDGISADNSNAIENLLLKSAVVRNVFHQIHVSSCLLVVSSFSLHNALTRHRGFTIGISIKNWPAICEI